MPHTVWLRVKCGGTAIITAWLIFHAQQIKVQYNQYSKHRAGNNKTNFWQSEVGHKGSHARVKNDPSRTARSFTCPGVPKVGSDVTHPVIQLGKAQALCTFTSIRCVVGFPSHSPPLHHPLSPIIFPSPRMFSLSFSSPLHLEVRVVCNSNKDPPKPFSSHARTVPASPHIGPFRLRITFRLGVRSLSNSGIIAG